jgi:hypothetical protein
LNRVDAFAHQVAGLAGFLPSTGQGDIGVFAQGQQAFAVSQVVLDAPVLGSVGSDQQVQATPVVQLAVSRHAVAQRGLGAAHRGITQCIDELLGHGDTSKSVPRNVPP